MGDYFRNKTAVITGGTSGIGLALAQGMLNLGSRVYLIGRSSRRLEEALHQLEQTGHGDRASGFTTDVANHSQIQSVLGSIAGEAGQIDFLINSAGIMVCGYFIDISPEDFVDITRINFLGTVNTCRAGWPYIEASRGHIGIVSSVAGYTGTIGYSAYASTKFAITGFAEALRMEAEQKGMAVSVLYPPDTDTPMLHYEIESAPPESRALNEKLKVYKPEEVAHTYLEGIRKGKKEIYCDYNSKFLRGFKTLFPGIFYDRVKAVIRKHSMD